MFEKLIRGEQVLEGFDASMLGAATQRDAALEAAIAEAPDAPEPYLVYADWLQARGDARGTLIALHDAARRGSRDAAAAAAALLETHGRSLMGELFMRNDIELEWFQGFIRAIRLRGQTVQQQLAVLRALFATPAGAVVQAITIDHMLEVERVIALLLQHGCETVTHLVIGKPSEWFIPAELIERYPRLAREPAVMWADALAAATKARCSPNGFDPDALPALALRDGAATAPPRTILAGIKAELANKKPIGMLAALRAVATRGSLDRFALALVQQWEVAHSANQLWALDAIGSLGGDDCAAFLEDAYRRWPHPRAVQALVHVRKIGTDAAISALARCAADTRQPSPRRTEAIALLEQVALTRNVDSLTQLLAQTCPRTPTSAAGQAIVEQQRRWLEDLMLGGQRMSRDDFDRHVAGHVVRQPLARGLVWGDFTGAQLRTAFVIDPFGDLRTHAGTLHQLPDDAHVGVVHPLELAPELRTGWSLAEEPPFDQLDRPLYALSPEEAARDHIDRYDRRGVGFTRLVPRLGARGWVQAMDDQGACYTREFPRDNAIARVALHGGAATDARVRRVAHWQYRQLDTLHPVTISELLADLEAFHAR